MITTSSVSSIIEQNVTGTGGFYATAMDQDESVLLASHDVVTKLDADGKLLWDVEVTEALWGKCPRRALAQNSCSLSDG